MNRDQWNNVFEFAKTFGEFRDTAMYDPDGGKEQNNFFVFKNPFFSMARND